MPHVAFALNNHLAHRPPAARPSPAPDRASSTPFASLIDDNAAAPERTPQSAADDKRTRAARSEETPQPANSTDSKAAKVNNDTNSADAGKTDKTDKTGKTDQIVKDGKTTADAKSGEGEVIADAKPAKPTEDNDDVPLKGGKPADTIIAAETATTPPTDLPTDLPTDPLPTSTPAVVSVTVIESDAEHAAAASTPAKANALAAPQTGKDNADNGATLAVKPSEQPHVEAKPQEPAGDAADKEAIAHARGEAPHGKHADTAHRATPAQANAALSADAMTAAPKAGAEAAPPIAHTAPLPTAAPAAPNAAANAPLPQPQPAAIPFAGIAVEIAGKALAGKNRFEIRLDPPELGRIEVRLHVDRDGNVTSRMIADRADTLDLLRRDVSSLERALQDAGLKTSDNGLQFSLRDQSARQEQADRAGDSARLLVDDGILPATDAAPRSYSRLAGLGSGVDIHV